MNAHDHPSVNANVHLRAQVQVRINADVYPHTYISVAFYMNSDQVPLRSGSSRIRFLQDQASE